MDGFGERSLADAENGVKASSDAIMTAFKELEGLSETLETFPRRCELMSTVKSSFDAAQTGIDVMTRNLNTIPAAMRATWEMRVQAVAEYLDFLESDRTIYQKAADRLQAEQDYAQLMRGATTDVFPNEEVLEAGRAAVGSWHSTIDELLETGEAALGNLSLQGTQLREIGDRVRVLVGRFRYGRQLLTQIDRTQRSSKYLAMGGMGLLIIGMLLMLWLL